MNTIIHDPTRDWLLLTEKWPDFNLKPRQWNEAAAHCLSTAKAKEKPNNNMNYPDFKKFTLLNPTDLVTSDGTKAKEYKCDDCGAGINEGEFKTFGVCDECWDKANPKPTESQDELWKEAIRLAIMQGHKETQKRFRIERI